VKVVAFATYSTVVEGPGTPFEPDKKSQLSLSSIRCTEKELKELVNDFNTRNSRHYRISDDLGLYIYKLTNGHIGHITTILAQFLTGNTQDTNKFKQYLCSYPFCSTLGSRRGMPDLDDDKDKDQVHLILKKVVLNKQIRINRGSKLASVVANLQKRGILTTNDDDFYFEFASPLVTHVVAAHLFRGPYERANQELTTFDDFLFLCLERISPSFLSESKGRSVEDKKLLERTWQMEFYRVATSCLPNTVFVSPDVGHVFGANGFLDFYVNDDKQWAIELTREGSKLTEHIERFGDGGEYYEIPNKDWVVLDFRSSVPRNHYLKDKVWYVVYKSDFSGATVKRKGKGDCFIQFLGAPEPNFWNSLINKDE